MTDDELKPFVTDIHNLALSSDKAPIPGVEHRECEAGAQRLLDYFRGQREKTPAATPTRAARRRAKKGAK